MDDLTVLVSGIEHKMMLLLKQQQEWNHERVALNIENQKLKNQVARQQEQIRQLSDQLKVLIFARDAEMQWGKEDAEKRIDELLREIDKCIALLSE